MSTLDRRQALLGALGFAGWCCSETYTLAQKPNRKAPNFAGVHSLMNKILEDCQCAGGALAVAHNGRQVLLRGYGLADVEKRRPVTRDTLFCIGSITKSITAVGVLKLVDEGKLKLDTPLVRVLNDLKPMPGKSIADRRFNDITVHHLLNHAGGLPEGGRAHSKDDTVADEDDTTSVVTLQYRQLMSKPLAFAPGTKSEYSNIGYLILRLAIEKAAHEDYEKYIRANILAPMGIKQMHLEKKGDYEENETRRYEAGGRKLAERRVANWLSTSIALVKFAAAVAGSGGKPFLSRKMTEEMLTPPAFGREHTGAYVGLGWDVVRKFPEGYRFAKAGGKPGVQAWLQHLEDGIDWAVFFNTSPPSNDRKARVMATREMPNASREALGLPTKKI
jgi:CubicO group peptidase (beta-lactamase class C family)